MIIYKKIQLKRHLLKISDNLVDISKPINFAPRNQTIDKCITIKIKERK